MTIVVCGAGPTGLALAYGLRQWEVEVRLVDSAAGPALSSRALALQPRGRRCWIGSTHSGICRGAVSLR
ncbi:FAD-dependent monooxygenase [Nocardia yunnanensis]|uniref:FAD-dependent oxidoreductase n=1 Tax=Nocardia yunnanensis TaxID=2382165 RepID=UPI001CA39142